MKKHKILKLAGVLLLSAVLLFSATAVTANTRKPTTTVSASGEFIGSTTPLSRDIVWDNGGDDGTGTGLSSQNDLVYPFNSQVADDFMLTTAADITGVHWWGQFWNGAGYPATTEFNIIFYADDGTGNAPTGAGTPDPTSTALAVYNFPSVTGTSVGTDRYSYEVTLPTAFSAEAGTKYWICCQWVGSFSQYGQWGWVANGANPEQLSLPVQGFPLLGTAYWTTLTAYGDMAYHLIGGAPGEDTTPPVTTCELDGTMEGGVYISDVTVTLSATDDLSGVDYTMYKIDNGAWTTYTVPFVVTSNGAHTIYFYSVDVAGNEEDEKTCTFTIEKEVDIAIEIFGGFGVNVVITNNGDENLTNVPWSINLEGSLILLGKSASGTVPFLPAGAEAVVKSFVVGLGKTTIAVTAGDVSATATGTVLLILVLGIQ